MSRHKKRAKTRPFLLKSNSEKSTVFSETCLKQGYVNASRIASLFSRKSDSNTCRLTYCANSRPKIFDQVKKIDSNKQKYQEYLCEVETIELGKFQCPIGKLKLDKLLNTERNIVNNAVQTPVTQFNITVTLYCSKINGRIYDGKIQSFCVEEIFSFINRLKNKSGPFYNDRDIWNSLCRVERGKVSNKMRFSIYERDGYRCRRCGVSERYAALEIDHIIPISKGGKSTYENLQTLCRKCNYEKGNKRYY